MTKSHLIEDNIQENITQKRNMLENIARKQDSYFI